jgi:hypothetical protein
MQESPAPIQEIPETPTPAAQPSERPNKPKPRPESTAKPRAPLDLSFAGTWSGTTLTENKESVSYIIKISDDERLAWVTYNASKTLTGDVLRLDNCKRLGQTLTWNGELQGDQSINDTLRLNGDGTAVFVSEGKLGANAEAGHRRTGTLTKNGAVRATDSGSHRTTETVTQPIPKARADVPVAKSVPNKPGYVYNPFDRNSKVLLNVSGKASGTKVKDPTSGKIFIVP